MIQQVPPELVHLLGALAAPAWVGVLSTAVIAGGHLALKIVQFKQTTPPVLPPSNGNGSHKGLSLADLNRITDKMDSGFQRLTDQLAHSEATIRSDMKSMSAYLIGMQLTLDKALEREGKE